MLGAGASFAYGLPLGIGLLGDISKLLARPMNRPGSTDRDNALYWQLRHSPTIEADNFSKNTDINSSLLAFCQSLREQDPTSIDTYLSQDFGPNTLLFRSIGKLAIAHVISSAESVKRFSQIEIPGSEMQKNNAHWYRYLWQECLAKDIQTLAQLKAKKLRIVSFNYDRSLEYYLGRKIAARFLATPGQFLAPEKSQEWAADGFSAVEQNLQITHPYGTLGSLLRVPYGNADNALKHGQDMANEINVIGEHRENGPDGFAEARDWIEHASRIVFLGFSYDPTNMKRLGLEQGLRSKLKIPDVYGSKDLFPLTRGFLRHERKRLRSKYFGEFWQAPADIQSLETPVDDRLPLSETHQNMEITEYLRKYGALTEI